MRLFQRELGGGEFLDLPLLFIKTAKPAAQIRAYFIFIFGKIQLIYRLISFL